MIAEYQSLESPAEDCRVYDYSKIESVDEFKSVAGKASVIWALDVKGKGRTIVYGTTYMRTIAQGVIPPQAVKDGSLVAFAFDFDAKVPGDDAYLFEHLLAAVEVTKGCHDYEGPMEKE